MTIVKSQNKYRNQARMLANKVKKKYKHLRKQYAKQNFEVFRLYDWDIPEIRAVVDWYGGHLVIGEYSREQSTPEWLPLMGQSVAKALNVLRKIFTLKSARPASGKVNGMKESIIPIKKLPCVKEI